MNHSIIASISLISFLGLAACSGSPSPGSSTSTGGSSNTGSTTSTGGASGTGGSNAIGGSTNPKLVAKSITAGDYHTCTVLSDGTVQCWGSNAYGQLGMDKSTTTDSFVPVTVSGITNAIAIAAGGSHSCALLSSGSVECWGDNSTCELGINNVPTRDSFVPVTVSGITNAIAIAAGSGHTCAVLSGGTIQCWGYNSSGALGVNNGTTSQSAVPVTVVGITNAIAVAAGGNCTCALLSSGTVQCWGENDNGELGNGTTTSSYVPVMVSGF